MKNYSTVRLSCTFFTALLFFLLVSCSKQVSSPEIIENKIDESSSDLELLAEIDYDGYGKIKYYGHDGMLTVTKKYKGTDLLANIRTTDPIVHYEALSGEKAPQKLVDYYKQYLKLSTHEKTQDDVDIIENEPEEDTYRTLSAQEFREKQCYTAADRYICLTGRTGDISYTSRDLVESKVHCYRGSLIHKALYRKGFRWRHQITQTVNQGETSDIWTTVSFSRKVRHEIKEAVGDGYHIYVWFQ